MKAGETMLKEGDKAPAFSLPNESGETISLDQFKGKKKVVYFYPKDDTPGCTKEACNFRDIYDQVIEKGAVILGVSGDSQSSHEEFKKKYSLPFHLLSDTNKELIQAFGTWGEKKRSGRTYEGIIRSTFIIDENNVIIKVFPKVKPAEHAEEILESL